MQAKRLVVVSYQTGHVAYRIYKGKEQIDNVFIIKTC
jgi:hypothetical protein